eukprot:TRINITY_DN4914_c0_g1_i2.p1 TRINITY_DN4914_c0_g1~~TRINITY_DN4914_c0_g1_i2.p1  ORF type:complete len:176 (-),score=30.05 TRINITY_DN4914_c0_g1_i2:83-610(-)
MQTLTNTEPSVGENSYIHPTSVIIGGVTIGNNCSVWPHAVLRADTETITIGDHSNIQDNVTIHADPGLPVVLGERVSVGHGAIVHSCVVHDSCIVGMNSTVLNGAVVGEGSIIGAGAVVKMNMQVPPGSLVIGVPGRVVKSGKDFTAMTNTNALAYDHLREKHLNNEFATYNSKL